MMSECRVCGISFREGDDVVTIGDHVFHHDCADPHVEPARRTVGTWAAMGSANQMAMGDVQRGED